MKLNPGKTEVFFISQKIGIQPVLDGVILPLKTQSFWVLLDTFLSLDAQVLLVTGVHLHN